MCKQAVVGQIKLQCGPDFMLIVRLCGLWIDGSAGSSWLTMCCRHGETQNKEVQSSVKSLTAVRRLRSGMAVSGVVSRGCHWAQTWMTLI